MLIFLSSSLSQLFRPIPLLYDSLSLEGHYIPRGGFLYTNCEHHHSRDASPIMASEQLRILIVGNGGREHAYAWKLSESPLVDIVYVAPGNGGTGLGTNSKITNANVKGDDYPGLVAFAQKNQVNLVVPGPEAPLVDGIQGYFQAGESRIPPFFFFFFFPWLFIFGL